MQAQIFCSIRHWLCAVFALVIFREIANGYTYYPISGIAQLYTHRYAGRELL
jgi:hypothetical protein